MIFKNESNRIIYYNAHSNKIIDESEWNILKLRAELYDSNKGPELVNEITIPNPNFQK